MRDIAAARPRFGYPRMCVMLRRQGWIVNHKKVLRIYREESLYVLVRRRKKRAAEVRVPIPPPDGPGQHWSIDFVSDALVGSRRIRVLTVIDNYTRECLALEVAASLPSPAVTKSLDRAIAQYGQPRAITCDNGTEFTANHFDAWAYARGIKVDFIDPGKPIQNALCESFNGSFRDECLNTSWFRTLDEARAIIEAWRRDYNEARPHSGIGNVTPTEYAAQMIGHAGL